MVTLSTALAPSAPVVRTRRIARHRGAAVVLPGTGVVAALLTAAAVLALTGALPLPLLAAVAVWPALLLLASGRTPSAGALARHHLRTVVRAVAAVGVGHWVLSGLVADAPPTLLISVAALAALTLAGAALAEVLLRRTTSTPRAVVVGDPADLRVVMSQVAAVSGRELDVVGGCTPAELDVTLDEARPDVVVVVPSPRLSGRAVQRLAWQLESGADGRPVSLLMLSGLQDVSVGRARPAALGGLGFTEVARPRHRGGAGVVKLVWERVAAALALLLLAPVLVTIALLVRRDSRGPALFRQTRVGRDGRLFTMLKFRTMRTDAEAVREALDSDYDEVLFKVRADPRVTRVGRVLRRYSLDELPQLLNVVRGEMSLVGPRPALPAEVAAYDHDPRRRLAVRPGLTGLWQVSGRSDLSWRETVRLDLDYVDNWSLGRDLAIVGRTLRAVVGHRGAY